MLALTLFALAPLSLNVATAIVFEPRDFASEEIESRYKKLIAEIRCLVCQNQNIADSNAPLAQDLRRQVFNMLNAQRSNQQILDYMVERYGDYVLYRPPLNAMTILLWFGPLALVVAGLGLLGATLLRKSKLAHEHKPLSDEERERLRRLIEDDSA